jgi:hypothetical protein
VRRRDLLGGASSTNANSPLQHNDRISAPHALALLVMAALAVAALGGRATATKPTTIAPDGDLSTVEPKLEAAIH